MLAGTPRISGGSSGGGVTFPVTPAQGGTGTTTVFTQGSVVFAGAAGVYTQDNDGAGNGFIYTKSNQNLHVGLVAGTSNATVGGTGAEFIYSNNSTGGANLILGNKSNGTSAFVDLFLQNDLADATGTHFAVVNLNSSTYNDATFGTINAVPNQFQIYGTDGPTLIGTSKSGSYVSVFVGGTTTTNEVTRFNASGLNIRNAVPATAGAQQALSPGLFLEAQGWNATTPATNVVQMREQLRPDITGTTPTATLLWSFSANGGAFVNAAQINSVGLFTANGITSNGNITSGGTLSTAPVGAASNFAAYSGVTTFTSAALLFAGASTVYARANFSGNNNQNLATGTSAANVIMGTVTYGTFTSGTQALIANAVFKPVAGTINGTATITNGATVYIEGAMTGAATTGGNYALWSLAGANRFGGSITNDALAGTGTRVVTADANGVLGTTSVANTQSVLSTTTGINAKTVANTLLFTNPSSLRLVVTGAVIRCTAATAITVGPTLGIGSASGTNDIFASATLTALTTTTNTFGFQLVGMSVSVAAGGTVYVNLSTAATGTSQTIAVDLIGYYI